MIAVDTSALMAILLKEPLADQCMSVLTTEAELLLSATTAAEALIVAARRGVGAEMAEMIDSLGFQIVDTTAATAKRVARIYDLWGKGFHAASLNFGDCFAYDVAKVYDCPLLSVEDDFAQTDLESGLRSPIG